jgi:cytochrome d ubiquinol oxidase subunit II
MDVSFLEGLWFIVLAILWIGYFVLEGFDFGVGMLVRVVGRAAGERRAVIHTIGPVWDGNEVWLIVAGAGTFAAFPEWYATLFSGFYIALFLLLAALIIRGVAFEFWGKRDDAAWRSRWEWAIIVGSFVPALLWGVAWTNIVSGTPIDREHEFTGNFFDLLGPFALLGGALTLVLFLAHGAIFLALRTKDELCTRAQGIAVRLTPVAAGVGVVYVAWLLIDQSDRGGVQGVSAVLAVLAALALIAAAVLVRTSDARAFFATCGAIILLFSALFADLYPNAMVSSTNAAYSLSLPAASSSHYTLVVMTVVAGLLVPFVLLYQGWTYWVFRARLGASDFPDVRGSA